MDQKPTKILTLDSINTIRKFINDRDNVTKTGLELTIEDEITRVRQTINDAKSEIENDYNSKVDELNGQLTTISEDNTAARAEIEAQIKLLEQNKTEQQATLDALNSSLTQLSDRVNNISSDLAQGGIFTSEQIGEIAKTAFIDSVKFNEDMIEAPTVMAKDIVSLVGHFGTIKAANIEGEEIAGHTIKSTSTITDETNPLNGQAAWTLNNAGDGHLAKGNISWDENGVVTLSDKVSITWDQVSGAQEVVDAVSEAADAANEAAANAQTAANNAQATADAANEAAANAQTAADNAQATANATPGIVDTAITTSLSQFEIASHKIKGDLISGKTMQSSEETTLANGTKFSEYTLNEDTGEYTIEDKQSDGNIPGPSWQIRNNGEGYLAKGNIQWNSEGKLVCNMDSGSVGGSNLISEDILYRVVDASYDAVVVNSINESLFCDKGLAWSGGVMYCDGTQCYDYKSGINTTNIKESKITKDSKTGQIKLTMSLPSLAATSNDISGIRLQIYNKYLGTNIFDNMVPASFTIKDVYNEDLEIYVYSHSVMLNTKVHENIKTYVTEFSRQPAALEDLLLGENNYEVFNFKLDNLTFNDYYKFLGAIKATAPSLMYIEISLNVGYTKKLKSTSTSMPTTKNITVQIPIYFN